MANIHIKIGDIEGESKDSSHEKEIDVLSWSWGLSQPGGMGVGGGGGVSEVNVHDLSFTKYVDNASPNLFSACCKGTHYKEDTGAVLTMRKPGDNPLEYLKIEMGDVLISSVSVSGSGGGDYPMESVSLNFAKVKVTYVPQQEDGSGGAENPKGWDIKKHEEL